MKIRVDLLRRSLAAVGHGVVRTARSRSARYVTQRVPLAPTSPFSVPVRFAADARTALGRGRRGSLFGEACRQGLSLPGYHSLRGLDYRRTADRGKMIERFRDALRYSKKQGNSRVLVRLTPSTNGMDTKVVRSLREFRCLMGRMRRAQWVLPDGIAHRPQNEVMIYIGNLPHGDRKLIIPTNRPLGVDPN